ncbi:MAG: hypothetical protein KTR28_07000 [Micavibrio sp.]|nr:hypothetical protein [Micavibrio sp.]
MTEKYDIFLYEKNGLTKSLLTHFEQANSKESAKKNNDENLIIQWDFKDDAYAKNLETLYTSSENVRRLHVITGDIKVIEQLKDAWKELNSQRYDTPKQTHFYCVATKRNHNKDPNVTTLTESAFIKMVSLES